MHGGKAAHGAASGMYKHGRHSKYMPAKLLENYMRSEADPELLSLRSETAILDARITELVGKLETGETASAWKALGDTWAEFNEAQRQLRKAREEGDADSASAAQDAAADAMKRIGALIEKGHGERAAWQELVVAVKDKQGVATAESKRLVDLEQTLSAEQALSFATALISIIKENVADRKVLNVISMKFTQLFNKGAAVPSRDTPALGGGEVGGGEVIDALPAPAATPVTAATTGAAAAEGLPEVGAAGENG